MAKVKVFNLDNKQVDEITLKPEVFEVEMNRHVVWEAMNAILANRRQGNASVKNRKDVSGGGKKPWRQKGTGRARAGSTRSPLWRSGGTVHGPQPRDFSSAIPKKKRRKAVRCLLSDKLGEKKLRVIDNFELGEIKTRALHEKVIKGMEASTVLLVDNEVNRELYLSSRNNPRMKTMVATDLNVYDLMKYEYVFLSVDAVKRIEEVLG
ncbi:MAG: 50S ribosomal protein L4 [Acidobacteria bacterium]|nr:50S ribosomal protein L4 [Acidobacteriota bacterium]